MKNENKDKMVPLDWSPSMRLSAWSDMVAHVGPAGSGKQVRAAGWLPFKIFSSELGMKQHMYLMEKNFTISMSFSDLPKLSITS